MKRFIKTGLLAALLLLLCGCIYDPGYARGDRYYGNARSDVYYGAAYGRGPVLYDDYGYDSPGYYYVYGPIFGFGFRYNDYQRGHYHRSANSHGRRR